MKEKIEEKIELITKKIEYLEDFIKNSISISYGEKYASGRITELKSNLMFLESLLKDLGGAKGLKP